MSIVSWLLDLLYPPKCVVCRRLLTGKGPVCPRCMDALPEFDGAAPAVRFTSGGAVSFFYEGQPSKSPSTVTAVPFGTCARISASVCG